MTTAADRIAIVGMAGRFPGAPDIEALWCNLCAGVESVRCFSEEELRQAGVDPRVIDDPDYVNAGAPLDEADGFDTSFFGVTPREAELMDPQHRIFLESAWTALEDAGCDPTRFDGQIGVFGAVARNTYFLHNALVYRDLVEGGATYEALLGSDKDFPATRAAYKLNLTGPAFCVQSACSSSGVALHLAYQSLLNSECDAAIVGGARVHVPQTAGYHWVEGGIPSRDGHCRPFDERAQGCIYGSGVATVILKRLEDAIEDRDRIYSVILASALNNDGADKAGFTAPSVSGQARVVAEALAVGDIDPDSIQYVEAHGTGTTLGDPIEVAALTRAFRQRTNAVQYCALGSLKGNIGHLDAGAGVAGLIKLSLMLSRRKLLPSINFSRPNPELDLATSPFYVNTDLKDWPGEQRPRRGAISSFGLGGTNFHAILEEPPEPEDSAPARAAELLMLSAKTPSALARSAENLVRFLVSSPTLNFSDVAFSLATGRQSLPVRQFVACQDLSGAVSKLERIAVPSNSPSLGTRHVSNTIFMFTGQGSQYPRMTIGLYNQDPVFRRAFDDCCEGLQSHLGLDLRAIIFCLDSDLERAEKALSETRITQPALFAVEYSLARSLQARGVTPAALVGHSIGEVVAATLAGVFKFEDAMAIVATRAALMQATPPGKMVAVQLCAEEVERLLPPELEIAAVNAPELVVVAGSDKDVIAFQGVLDEREVGWRPVRTSHAFHSRLMESAVDPFTEFVSQFTLNPPEVPIVSNVTGSWLRDEESTQPAYWGEHIRQPVLFNHCLDSLLELNDPAFMEVGPGSTLASFIRQKVGPASSYPIISCVRDARLEAGDQLTLLAAYGQLWANGANLDTGLLFSGSDRRKVSLPTYPFERQRYWLSSSKASPMQKAQRPVEQLTSVQEITDAHRQAETFSNGLSDGPSPERAANLVLVTLKNLLHELSGVNTESLNPNMTFLELGFDSLFLTRLVAELKKRFGVRVLFRRLFEDLTTIEQIASHLAQEAPGRFAPPAGPRTPTQATEAILAQGAPPGEAPGKLSEMGSLLQRQLELMKEQMDILSQQVARATLATSDAGGERLLPPADAPKTFGPCVPQAFDPARTAISIVAGCAGEADQQSVAHSLAANMRNASLTTTTAHRAEFKRVRADLDSLCTALVVDLLRSNGIQLEAGRTLSRDQVMAALAVRSPYGKLIDYFFKLLRDDGFVEGDPQDELTVTRAISAVKTPQALAAEIEQQHPSFSALCKLLANCAAALPEVLRGELPGVAVLLPDGTRTMIKEVLQAQTPDYRGIGDVQDALARELVKLATIRPIRILEVGGGGGDLTWRIVPKLPAGTHYHFTELSPTMVQDARRRGTRVGGARMSYSIVDVTNGLLEQGIESASFDVVVAVNVIHATPDVADVFENLFEALAPGGVVCAIEHVGAYRWDQMIWGLTPQWWLFEDSIRKDSPLMDLAQWQRAVEPLKPEAFEWFPATPANDVHDSRLLLLRPGSRAAGDHPVASPKAPEALSSVASASASAAKVAHGPYRPMERGPAGALTPAQRKHLDALIARYVRRTAESKRLTEASRPHLADPRSVAGFRRIWKEMVYPIVVDRSSGSKLWDVDGNEYIDLVCGFGPILLGHNPAIVREAIKSQLDQGIETGPQTPLAGKVAQLFCEMTGMERVAFCNTGSEAVLAAIRVARTVTGRDLIVMFSGAYHGIFDEVLVRAAKVDGISRPIPLAPGIPSNMTDNILVLEYGSPAALDVVKARGHELAAVLVEPVQSRRPDLQPRDFVKRLRELTQASGTALILDEVVTGFRTHSGGIQALWEVRADLATYGKVVGGGLPIGLVAGCAKYMDALDGGMWCYGDDSFPEVGVTFFAGTFVRHPLALAAAHAVLTHLKSEGPELQRRLNLRTTQLVEALTRQVAALAAPFRITHFSSWLWLNLPAELPFASLLYPCMRARGVHLLEGRPVFITTAHSDADLERVVHGFRDSIIELQAGDFLPGGEEQPPVPGARRGRDLSGKQAWFVSDPKHPRKYLQVREGAIDRD